ncbi:MAG: hypothetical protein ACI87E_004288, partial [Mariniblastus sp.]
ESMAEGFRDRTDAIAILLHTKIEDTFQELDLKISQIPQGQGEPRDHGEPQPLEPEPIIDTASHWHRQKEAMLSKYGIDPDYRPLMELPQTTSADSSESPSVDSQAIEGLQNSASELSEADAIEIARIKEELNAKLREAEIELSINRAKLSQQKAMLESKQVELDRRASSLDEKYAAIQKAPKQRVGFLDRLSLHLGKEKKP